MNPRIPQPCTKTTWNALPGDDTERHCAHCATPVYALDRLAEAELEQIRSEAGRRLCGYDVGELARQHRSRRTVIAGALLTAIAPLLAQDGRVRFRIRDMSLSTSNQVIGAEVILLEKSDGPIRTLVADSKGEVLWTGLPMGESTFQIRAPGFKIKRLTVTLKSSEETKQDVVLEIGPIVMGVFVKPRATGTG